MLHYILRLLNLNPLQKYNISCIPITCLQDETMVKGVSFDGTLNVCFILLVKRFYLFKLQI